MVSDISIPQECCAFLTLTFLVDNLDQKLMAFLEAKFPAEVKAKQKENQHAAGVDLYGEDFDKCAIM